MNLRNVVVANKVHYSASDTTPNADVRGIQGLNVWLPPFYAYCSMYRDQYRTLDFDQDTGWSTFLDALYGPAMAILTVSDDMAGLIAWVPEVTEGGPELDLYVIEPTWDPETIYIASPALGPESLNGFLSPDSFWTGQSWEAWAAKPVIFKGVYVFLANYFSDGWQWMGCDVTFGGTLHGDVETIGPYYLDSTTVYDEDLGPGWIAFGYYNRSVSSVGPRWRMTTLREAGLSDAQAEDAVGKLSDAAAKKKRKQSSAARSSSTNILRPNLKEAVTECQSSASTDKTDR